MVPDASQDRRNRAISTRRKLFLLAYNLIGKYLPRSTMPYSFGSRRIREFLVRNFISRCGKNLIVETGVSLSPEVEIGDNCLIGENSRVRGRVILGDDVMIAQDVNLIAFNHRFDRADIPVRLQGEDFGVIEIGDDVWIGINAVVLNNIRIGHHAVLGAGAVVSRDVPDWAVMGGIPADIIRYRNH